MGKKNSTNIRLPRPLLILAILVLVIIGISNFGHTVEKTHEESISYQTYEPGLELKTPVSFRAVKAEFTTITRQVNEISTMNHISSVIYHVYLTLTDENGNQLTAEVYSSLLGETLNQVETMIDQINEEGGTLYYGWLDENEVDDQEIPSYEEIYKATIVERPSLVPASISAEARQYTAQLENGRDQIQEMDEMLISGTEPGMQTIVDSSYYVLDFGIVCLAAALLLAILVVLTGKGKKRSASTAQGTASGAAKENNKTATGAAKENSKIAAGAAKESRKTSAGAATERSKTATAAAKVSAPTEKRLEEVKPDNVIWQVGHHGTPHQIVQVWGMYYEFDEVTDRMNGGRYTARIPISCFLHGRLNKRKLLEYINSKEGLWGFTEEISASKTSKSKSEQGKKKDVTPDLKKVFMEVSAGYPTQKDMLRHVRFSEKGIWSNYVKRSNYSSDYCRPSIEKIKDQYEVIWGMEDDMRGPAGLKRFTDLLEAMRYFVEGIDNHYQWEEYRKQLVREGKGRDGKNRAESAARDTASGKVKNRSKSTNINNSTREDLSALRERLISSQDKLFDDRLNEAITARRSIEEENARRKNEAFGLRVDLLKKPYCTRQRDKELYYVLVSDNVPYDETSIKIDIRNGNLYKIHNHVDMRSMSHETCTPIDADELKRFVADLPSETREKFAAFTDENWKSFVPKTESKERSEEKPETLEVRDSALSKEIIEYPDFDAFYVRTERHFGSDMTFLRRTDSGWRAFALSPGFLRPEDCTEKNIADRFLNSSPCRETYICCDRLLDRLDLKYIMSVMPPYCPEERPSGQLRRSTPISMYKDDITVACYYKNGTWIPCADFENIVEMGKRISNAARYNLTFL